MPARKGHPKAGGRTRGTRNKIQADVAVWCRSLIESVEYRSNYERRLKAGELAPQLEVIAWHYGYGKPIERVEHSGPAGGPIVVHDHFAVPEP